MRINLANAQELLELPGLGRRRWPPSSGIARSMAPSRTPTELATILRGFPLTDALRARADFSPADATAPEAPGA